MGREGRRCESCMARIAYANGDTSAKVKAMWNCECDPLSKPRGSRIPDCDIAPRNKSECGRSDQTYTTDEQVGSWSMCVRAYEELGGMM